MENKNLFVLVANMASELDTLYRNNSFGQKDLLEFMVSNEWFGISYTLINGSPEIEVPIPLKLKNALTLWISAYKKPGRDKIRLMLKHFGDVYPETCKLYRKFVSTKHLVNNHNAWRLLDYLFSEIDKEITSFSETDLEAFMQRMDTDIPLVMTRMFSDFLQSSTFRGKSLTKWFYSFDSRECPELIRDAYPARDFAVMAYCTFNEKMWAEQHLIKKAVQSKIYADIWLFVAMHFICALRTSDMKRLPAPALPYAREIVVSKILNGTFTKQEATTLTDELSIRLKMKPLKPSKTSVYEKIPDLKLSVPVSLKSPLGNIIAIALIHYPEIKAGDGFITPPSNMSTIQDFFGDHFARALGGRRFSSIRCNKSYLQGIDNISNDNNPPGKPKGYMLASLARSHKSSIEVLSNTTDIYLKGATFSGYTPEFIIQQMFERGVFSFIPTILLEIYAGSIYTTLTVGCQTELICSIGLDAHRIEWMAETIDRVLIKSKTAIYRLLKDPARIKERVYEMLQNIASGNAPGKQDECLCLMTAAGFTCPSPDRYGCIGCGYEIYTTTAMHTLMKEYMRLTHMKNNSEQSQAWRYVRILDFAILPAIAEMLAVAKQLYPSADITGLLDIMEEGIAYAGLNTKGN